MRRSLSVLIVGLLCAGQARAQGLLVPTQTDVPPLAMRSHEVTVTVEDQVAVTKVVQTFRNDTDRPLEATYVFPVPKGASVRKFVMWVDGKEVPGELVEAEKARQVYTDIVRRMKDPGLLEYVGNNLLRVRVFPVPARGDQKLAVSYTSVAGSDAGLIEYVYPLRADGKNAGRLEKFSLHATLKAQHPIQNVYSPTHSVTIKRVGEREAHVCFEAKGAALDKDFQLYYTAGSKDVGLTALLHHPDRSADGHFMMLISPRAELARQKAIPRDMVFVLDTSGSMQGKRIQQARNALKYCLRSLGSHDRFAMIQFATTVNKYRDKLLPAKQGEIDAAQRWVDGLEAVGSTNISEALSTALDMRPGDGQRNFTIVFFTDGQPTIGETDPARIVKSVMDKNSASTRIFTFGVGDDVNTVLLDQLADKTRSVSTYVRESEDIEAKVSGLYSKISHPVLTNLKLKVGDNVTLSEVYPPQLPDLFHGTQLVVVGRYSGHGHAAVTLTGTAGDEHSEFVYEIKFPGKTNGDKAFVEDLWARRKVGYLLDQIRTHGENKELRDEVVALAKKYGITTPYTSYLVVPDVATPVANAPMPPAQPAQGPNSFNNGDSGSLTTNSTFTPQNGPAYYKNHGYQGIPGTGGPATSRIQYAPTAVAPTMTWAVPATSAPAPQPTTGTAPQMDISIRRHQLNAQGVMPMAGTAGSATAVQMENAPQATPFNPAMFGDLLIASKAKSDGKEEEEEEEEETEQKEVASGAPGPLPISGEAGVNLATRLSEMRNQNQVGRSAAKQAAGRNCLKIRGVWVDDGFDSNTKTVAVKAMSAAYFRILERQPQMREVFRLGNRVVWVTPCGTALVIALNSGAETLTDAEIDALFVAKP